MARTLARWIVGFPLLLVAAGAGAQVSGSDGSFGLIDVQSGEQTLQLPPDGIINATTVTVAQGATLRFDRNALNTPVLLLATGDINVEGTIDVTGNAGTATGGGAGGPGGFDGGAPGRNGQPPGAGFGPGAGLGGISSLSSGNTDNRNGLAAYGSVSTAGGATNGQAYGSPLLVPMVGGSGGGGSGPTGTIVGGGGGGGAILLASDTLVAITGTVNASGPNRSGSDTSVYGSGGAIRVVAPVVSGAGSLIVLGGRNGFISAGYGRIRVDTIDLANINFVFTPSTAITLGSFLIGIPPNLPRLDIVDVAGTPVPPGTTSAVDIILPFGTPNDRTITVRATNFTGVVPIRVVVTLQNGVPIVTDTDIDMAGGNTADLVVPVDLPQNTLVNINVFTRDS